MNDFDYDVLQKKRIARNAKYKVRNRHIRFVRMPSDSLSYYQKRKLNGAVTVYKIGQRISWNEFRSYPEDIQIEYMMWVAENIGCSTGCLPEIFGATKGAIASYFVDHRYLYGILPRRTSDIAQARLKEWLDDKKSEVVEEVGVLSANKQPEIPYFAHVLKNGEFTLEGTGVEISQTLFGIFRDSKIRISLSFEAIEEEEELENEELPDVPAEC